MRISFTSRNKCSERKAHLKKYPLTRNNEGCEAHTFSQSYIVKDVAVHDQSSTHRNS